MRSETRAVNILRKRSVKNIMFLFFVSSWKRVKSKLRPFSLLYSLSKKNEWIKNMEWKKIIKIYDGHGQRDACTKNECMHVFLLFHSHFLFKHSNSSICRNFFGAEYIVTILKEMHSWLVQLQKLQVLLFCCIHKRMLLEINCWKNISFFFSNAFSSFTPTKILKVAHGKH